MARIKKITFFYTNSIFFELKGYSFYTTFNKKYKIYFEHSVNVESSSFTHDPPKNGGSLWKYKPLIKELVPQISPLQVLEYINQLPDEEENQ